MQVNLKTWSATKDPETVLHLQRAREALAYAYDRSPSGELSDERAERIKEAAQHLEGIQVPTELRTEALDWAKDLRALL